MSEPSFLLTVARRPFLSSSAENSAIAFWDERTNPFSRTSFTGMRLTCMGIVSLLERRREFKRFASSVACALESFFPEISVYSNEILLSVE